MAEDTKYVRGAQRLSQRIKTIQSRLAVPVLTDQIGELLLKRTLDRFEREVDPDGVAWPDHSEATLKRRGSAYGRKKLQQTKALKEAIKVIKGGAGSTFTNTGAGVRIGIPAGVTNSRGEDVATYGRTQNKGNGRIPARRFLGIGRNDVTAVDSFLRRYAAKALED